MTLGERLNGARIISCDETLGLTLVWRGGHGVHVYNDAGQEVWSWNVRDGTKGDVDIAEVILSMEDRMETGEYSYS